MTTVFFDIDTQIDFLFPAGALYAPGAERIIPTVAKLNHYAARHGIPVVSTMDAHSENDPEFRDWPPHCVVGTVGQQKPASMLLEKRHIVPNSPCSVSINDQILLEKQTFSCLSNVNFDLLPKADRYVVYGVVTEVCVKFAAFGLLERGKRVEIVTDAVRALTVESSTRTLKEFEAAGISLTTSAVVIDG